MGSRGVAGGRRRGERRVGSDREEREGIVCDFKEMY